MKITQPLREEHKDLLPFIMEIGTVADSVAKIPDTNLQKKIQQIREFLQKKLIPHALAEDEVLYPMIDKLAGSEEVTKTMKYDHKVISSFTDKLLNLQYTDKAYLQKVLYELSVIVDLHFQKEEKFLLPFLDEHLKEDDARELFQHMEEVATRIKNTTLYN